MLVDRNRVVSNSAANRDCISQGGVAQNIVWFCTFRACSAIRYIIIIIIIIIIEARWVIAEMLSKRRLGRAEETQDYGLPGRDVKLPRE
jgi:hypothetical protein